MKASLLEYIISPVIDFFSLDYYVRHEFLNIEQDLVRPTHKLPVTVVLLCTSDYIFPVLMVMLINL